MNRTRDDSARGTIVTWYAPVRKQMALAPGSTANSTHEFVCAQYCPQDGEFFSEIQIGDGQSGPKDTPKFVGTESISQPAATGGKTVMADHWKWTETIFGIIPMEENDFYVDTTSTPPSPFFARQQITPFGGAKIGEENASFIDYQPKDVSSFFDIDPASIDTCEKSDNCDDTMGSSHPAVGRLRFAKSMHQQAKEWAAERLAAGDAKLKDDPVMPNISFADDFSASEDSVMLINQGGVKAAGGDICCDGSSTQCQVQLSHFAGKRYYDKTNQRSRVEDSVANEVQIDFYGDVHKSVLVEVVGGVETCKEYCPIDPDDHMSGFSPFDPFDDVSDLGPTTYAGKPAQHYQWSDVIFKVIKMQTTDFYADISNPKAAIPYFAGTVLTPFGQAPIGTQNQTWTNWDPTTPPAAKFNVSGVDVCPRAQNCGSSSRQLRRLQARQFHTFYRHHLAEVGHSRGLIH
jgi:hypothetical protein